MGFDIIEINLVTSFVSRKSFRLPFSIIIMFCAQEQFHTRSLDMNILPATGEFEVLPIIMNLVAG